MEPTFFSTQIEFRAWLEANHAIATELIVGFRKVASGKPSMSWPESVDQALCFGWIDGVRKSIDAESYQIRFTPRKKDSIWSYVNIKKMEELQANGQMRPEGMAAFAHRTEAKSLVYSFEAKEAMVLSTEYLAQLEANSVAWTYFQGLAAGYKRSSVHWVMSAKQAETRDKRFAQFLDECSRQFNQWKDSKYKK